MKLIFAILGFTFIFTAAVSYAAEKADTAAALHVQPIARDSAKWKREPFIRVSKKTDTPVPGYKLTSKTLPKAVVPQINAPLDHEEDINLQGIMNSGTSYHALVNGRVVKVGDEISGVMVKEINRYDVVVLNAKKEKVIYDIYQGRNVRGKK